MIVVTAFGTRGDVDPFIAIARELRRRRHVVTAVTNCAHMPCFQSVGAKALAVDEEDDYRRMLDAGHLATSLRTTPLFFRRHVLPTVERTVELLTSVRRETEAVVARSSPDLAARMFAEVCGAPVLWGFTSPFHLTTAPLAALMYGGPLAAEINSIRCRLRLPPVSDWARWIASDVAAAFWPRWFGSQIAGSPEQPLPVYTGFMTYDDEAGEGQGIDVVPGTVVVTGGSTRAAGRRLYEFGVEACVALGRPGILLVRDDDLVPSPLPPDVRRWSWAPAFGRLLREASLVVHHGGMGTVSQALAAGVPQLILAFGAERIDNGSRVEQLGVGRLLPATRWDRQSVAESATALMTSEVRDRCRHWARRHAEAIPIETTCRALEQLIQQRREQKPGCRTGGSSCV